MSAIYWRSLSTAPSEDSDLLKDYQILSEKVNEYYKDRDLISEFPSHSIIFEKSKITDTKIQKRNKQNRNASVKHTTSKTDRKILKNSPLEVKYTGYKRCYTTKETNPICTNLKTYQPFKMF